MPPGWIPGGIHCDLGVLSPCGNLERAAEGDELD